MSTIQDQDRKVGWTPLILLFFTSSFTGIVGYVGVENIPMADLILAAIAAFLPVTFYFIGYQHAKSQD